MSKSLGNLVFVDKLRTEWDPMAIRLGLIEHHYRTEWEWDDELMPRNAERLRRWRDSADGQVERSARRGPRAPRRRSRHARVQWRRSTLPRPEARPTRAAATLLGVQIDARWLTRQLS